MSTRKAWREAAIKVAANPHQYSASERYLAWCFLYEEKTGRPVRQTALPPCEGAVQNKEQSPWN
jgi:hypothetical protein